MTTNAQKFRADQVRADRQVWRDLVAEVGRDRMLESGPMGEWTFKDMAAIEGLLESVADDPDALPWAGGTPAVDINWTDHLHDEHLPDVRAWLEAREQGPK